MIQFTSVSGCYIASCQLSCVFFTLILYSALVTALLFTSL